MVVVKKSEVKEYLLPRRRWAAMQLFAASIVLGVAEIYVLPKIITLFTEMHYPLPFLTKNSLYISLITEVVLLLLAFNYIMGINEQQLQNDLQKYGESEAVEPHILARYYKPWIVFIAIVFVGFYITIVSISPIYSLIGNFSR